MEKGGFHSFNQQFIHSDFKLTYIDHNTIFVKIEKVGGAWVAQ